MGKLAEVKAMINAKEAAKKAKDYFNELTEEPLTSVILEEVERTEKSWFITFGYTTNDVLFKRYKRIQLDSDTGEFVAMKIRYLD